MRLLIGAIAERAVADQLRMGEGEGVPAGGETITGRPSFRGARAPHSGWGAQRSATAGYGQAIAPKENYLTSTWTGKRSK